MNQDSNNQYGEPVEAEGLSPDQVERYQTNGWLAPIDVMTPSDAAAVLAELERAEAQYPDDLHPEHRNNAHLAFPFLADVATNDRIVSCVQSLLGPDLSLWSTVLFIKEPDSSAYVSWHQDAYYMGLEPDHFVTAWLALTPSTVESGCVSVIPGSHEARADHADTFGSDNILTRGQEVADIDPTAAVHLELAPGQMSLHHPWLVHGSQPNRSGARRVGIAMQSFLAGNVRPVRGTHHVLPISGQLASQEFVVASPPIAECSTDARAARAAANAALADVLYHGAQETRSL